jgi:hypothetical protein
MSKGTLGAAAVALALSSAAVLPHSALALTIAQPPARAIETAGLVEKTDIFCGPLGCGPVWPGPRRSEWGPWGHVYRPACPINYYYACRRGPLGYGQCACWPYRTW